MSKVKNQYNLVNKENKPPAIAGLYVFGFFGTAVYFISNSEGYWGFILAVLKALVWPAFLINRVFEVLGI